MAKKNGKRKSSPSTLPPLSGIGSSPDVGGSPDPTSKPQAHSKVAPLPDGYVEAELKQTCKALERSKLELADLRGEAAKARAALHTAQQNNQEQGRALKQLARALDASDQQLSTVRSSGTYWTCLCTAVALSAGMASGVMLGYSLARRP